MKRPARSVLTPLLVEGAGDRPGVRVQLNDGVHPRASLVQTPDPVQVEVKEANSR